MRGFNAMKETGDKEKILQYLKTHEMEVYNAKASQFICDVVFSAYVESGSMHGYNLTPILVYIKGGNDFFEIAPHEHVVGIAKAFFQKCLKDTSLLDETIKAHEKLTDDIIY